MERVGDPKIQSEGHRCVFEGHPAGLRWSASIAAHQIGRRHIGDRLAHRDARIRVTLLAAAGFCGSRLGKCQVNPIALNCAMSASLKCSHPAFRRGMGGAIRGPRRQTAAPPTLTRPQTDAPSVRPIHGRSLAAGKCRAADSELASQNKADQLYVNFTGFPFPLGPLLFRRTVRYEVRERPATVRSANDPPSPPSWTIKGGDLHTRPHSRMRDETIRDRHEFCRLVFTIRLCSVPFIGCVICAGTCMSSQLSRQRTSLLGLTQKLKN